jgi:hyperosmotically inducible periplasmic protein
MNSLPTPTAPFFHKKHHTKGASIMNVLRYLLLSGFLVMPLIAPGCASGPQSTGVGEHVDDSMITTKVKAALLRDSNVDGLDIDVKTVKGRVQLSGFVNKTTQVKRAAQLAHEVEGVRSVTNSLVIKPRPRRYSEDLRRLGILRPA